MALFDDEQDDTDSDGWGVDEDRRTAEDAAHDADDAETESTPLSELDTAMLSRGNPNGTLKRAVDREAGVVVYAYKNGNAGGLSTVPLSETDLVAEDGSE